MENNTLRPLTSATVKRAFDKAAARYDQYAVLQRAVADNLLDSLDLFSIKPKQVVDLGAGTGYCSEFLLKRFPKAKLCLCDISEQMLQIARSKSRRWFKAPRYVCADINTLPFADDSLDVLFSSLAFQWCLDLDRLFAECYRVLKPNGLIVFSTLGPDTLRELRQAFATVEQQPHVHDFIDMHDIGDALIRAGFSAPVLQTDVITMTYQTMREVMRDLRGIGAVNQAAERRRGFSPRALFQRAEQRYEAHRRQGVLPATYEVVYAHAFSPTTADPPQDGSQVAAFPLEELTKMIKTPKNS